MFVGGEFAYLRIVAVNPSVLECVKCAFQKIVEIAPPVVGRVEFEFDFKRPLQRFAPAERLRHQFPIDPPIAADEHARTNMAVIVIQARRKRQFKFAYRAHGAPADLLADGACGAV